MTDTGLQRVSSLSWSVLPPDQRSVLLTSGGGETDWGPVTRKGSGDVCSPSLCFPSLKNHVLKYPSCKHKFTSVSAGGVQWSRVHVSPFRQSITVGGSRSRWEVVDLRGDTLRKVWPEGVLVL